jgi:GntR family transcriptional regulator of vanillate catabolism
MIHLRHASPVHKRVTVALNAELTGGRHRPRLVDEIVELLRDRIVTGDMQPGTKLLQLELAEQLKVSRTPLREALRILENDGLVRTHDGNRTVVVAGVSAKDVQDMYQVREVVDGLAARLAAERGFTRELEREAKRLLKEMSSTVTDLRDPQHRTRTHARFHELILQTSGNTKLEAFRSMVRTSSSAAYMPTIEDPSSVMLVRQGSSATFQEFMEEAEREHAEIFATIKSGDPEAAEVIARKHIRRAMTTMSEIETWRRTVRERPKSG